MTSNVASLQDARLPRKDPPDIARAVVKLPFSQDADAQLAEILAACGLEQDARQLFLYVNLQLAAQRVVQLVSACWPSLVDKGSSACAEAITAAIHNVQKALREHQDGHVEVIGGFLAGLSLAADAVLKLQAWGYRSGRPVEQYDHNSWNFVAWAHAGEFDEIRFYDRNKDVRRTDMRGNRIKLICSIADSRDVGYFHNYVTLHGYDSR